MKQDMLSEIRSKGQAGIARRMYGNAEETQALLKELGTDIATKHGCRAVFGGLKGKKRAEYKVEHKFGGDWYGLTDVVRMTIIAPDMKLLRQVQADIRRRCKPSNGMSLPKDVDLQPSQSPCGYSGLNFVVTLGNKRPGEIQVNVPGVMYGQLGPDTFVETLGSEAFQDMKGRYGVEGGLGHTFYEIYRVAPGTDNGKAAAQVSRLYFDFLRGTPEPMARNLLQQEIDQFKLANKAAFLH